MTKLTLVLLAGLAVLVLVAPFGGVLHSSPPVCLSTFGYRVPCGQLIPALGNFEWSIVAGAATAVAVATALRSKTS
jgi:hypothetical protein